ncbi:hypothetical protein PS6_011609 [Mucor atramentarius]
MDKRIQDLDSDDEVVQDVPIRTKASTPPVATVTVQEFIKQKDHPKHIKGGAAKMLNGTKRNQRRLIIQKIGQFVKDKQTIQSLELRRQRYLEEILPYIKDNLTNIYQLDNEPATYNQLKYKFLKKLFPDDVSSAITFSKKYLKHHH